MNSPLLTAISASSITLFSAFTAAGWKRHELIALAYGLLGIAWAHSFMDMTLESILPTLRCILAEIGAEVDHRDSAAASCPYEENWRSSVAGSGYSSGEPHIE